MTRRVVGPFNRVEGDLEVHLEIGDGKVDDAWVVSPLFRGFERILHGKDPRDAMVYTPRICGICSVSQSVAAASALADAQSIEMPPNGELTTNLILGNENVADHLTHFYLFFMPDFARAIYASEPWYDDIADRFRAVSGLAAREMLPARAEFMQLMGLLAGKWPHSLAIQPGGTTLAIGSHEKTRVGGILFGFRRFLENTVFGDTLEAILSIDSGDALDAWQAGHDITHSDFSRFLHIAEALELEQLGRASDVFLSYGAYRVGDGWLFDRGVWKDGDVSALDPGTITEDASHSWMARRRKARHPYEGITIPEADAEDGYTWCKAPRLGDEVVEVGALARQLVTGHPLIRDLVGRSGGNVRNRVIARLLEIAAVTVALQDWQSQLRPGESFCANSRLPGEGEGCGLVEAARGSLGHWLIIEKGRIRNYQIVAPTTWNFSPRDSRGVRGALEQALRDVPLRDGETDPVAVQHVVRSFDPCMVCTVH